MASAASAQIQKRRLTFSIFILILLSIFLAGYYFYYVPQNRENLHHNAFVILENINQSILDRNAEIEKRYNTFFDEFSRINNGDTLKPGILRSLLKRNNVEGEVSNTAFSTDSIAPTRRPDRDLVRDSEVHLRYIHDGKLVYGLSPATKKNEVTISLPAAAVFRNLLINQKKEVFESYLLVNRNNGIIYHDEDLPVNASLLADSVLPKNRESFFSGVTDLKIRNQAYKVFYYPINIDNQQLELCGFIKGSSYNGRLSYIPPSFVYPIVIVFLLLIILMPIIKFYIMGSDEQVKLLDLISFGHSLFVGTGFLTLIIIHILLLWAADDRAGENLNRLSDSLQIAFKTEVQRAYRQLTVFDSLRTADSTNQQKNFNDGIARYLQSHKKDSSVYFDFDRVSWINQAGQQWIKGQVDCSEPILTNISGRKYFELFRDDLAYPVPGIENTSFVFEPLYSWTNDEFRILMSKRTRYPGLFIATISAKFTRLTHAVLPQGFGFAIINPEGDVQIHLDPERNLRENLIEKIDNPQLIREAIASRQKMEFNDIRFYGKTQALNIQPLDNMPFFLVTYYDKGYVLPVNMRILCFALLFCMFSYVFCLLIWVVVFRKSYYIFPLLYSPMDFFRWATPTRNAALYYFHSMLFMGAYILAILLSTFLSAYFNISNYVILLLVLMIPVNLVTALFVVNHATNRQPSADQPAPPPRRFNSALQALFAQLVFSIVLYLMMQSADYPIEKHFLLFQLVFNLVLWIYYFVPPKTNQRFFARFRSHFTLYSIFVIELVVLTAVIPSSLFTWYAHNQEILQSVKKQQLYMAGTLLSHRNDMRKMLYQQDSTVLPAHYYENMLYKQAVFSLLSDSVYYSTSQGKTDAHEETYEKFYFRIATKLNIDYYDPEKFPALENSASDNAWVWMRKDSIIDFSYSPHPDGYVATHDQQHPETLRIVSHIPPRFVFVKPSVKGAVLLLLVIVLVIILYRMLKSSTQKLFFHKYVRTVGDKPSPLLTPAFIAKMRSSQYVSDQELDDMKFVSSGEDSIASNCSRDDMECREKEILETIRRLKKVFDFTWKDLSDKQQYLLYDYSRDGLMNFKNTPDIYSLISKGIFVVHGEELKIFSASFRAYVLMKKNSEEMLVLQKKFQQNSTWQTLRAPLMLVLLGIAAFIFFTQEQTFQKIMALVAGVSSVSSLLLKFFVDNGSLGNKK